MSIVEQIAQTKEEMAALAACFQQGGLAITDAAQKVTQYQALQRQLEDLRMNHQFAAVAQIILGDGDELEGPDSGDVGPRLRQLAVHIVRQLSPQTSSEQLLDMVDRLHDVSDTDVIVESK